MSLTSRHTRGGIAHGAVLLVVLAIAPWIGEAVANPKLILTTWRIEPSTVKENQPWSVKLWVGNIGTETPRKGFTIQVLGCDKDYVKCETEYAIHQVKLATDDLAPGKLPGKEIVIDIKKGLAKGEHFILVIVDSKKEVSDAPIRKQLRVPVGFYKF